MDTSTFEILDRLQWLAYSILLSGVFKSAHSGRSGELHRCLAQYCVGGTRQLTFPTKPIRKTEGPVPDWPRDYFRGRDFRSRREIALGIIRMNDAKV